jgi:hypothetical protein
MVQLKMLQSILSFNCVVAIDVSMLILNVVVVDDDFLSLIFTGIL